MAMINTRNSQIHGAEPGVKGVGQRHKELIPLNPRLWQIVVVQAKAKFHKWPSPAASHWAHEKYKQMGGRFKTAGDKDQKELASHQRMEKDKDETKDERAKGRKQSGRKGRHKKDRR